MRFDNRHMIEQTLNTHLKEVEVIYWILEDSIYNGKQNKAKAMLEILLYLGKYKPELIQSGLHAAQRSRLKDLTHQILENTSVQRKEAVTIKFPIREREIPFKCEAELQSHLVDKKEILEEALKDRIEIQGTEVKAGEDYRCDIVAESKEKFYPIELKIAQGTHAVVSQCSKYCYYFYRKLRYDRFKPVQGIVIANGYCSWSINALRQEGHWIYNIIPTGNSDIILERIP